MLIGDLVKMDASGDFRSDVQLSDYDNPTLNQELVRNYILTVLAPTTYGAQQRNMSARDVLDQLKTIFTVERAENRIVLTANYGRGKSHLALVLANFFARASDSPEVKTILARLDQALNNPAQLAGYRDFKSRKGEFLVVRLQGDAFSDLQEGFIGALEQALREHAATEKLELPFWDGPAKRWLDSLSGERRQAAEAFLATQNTDLAHLAAGLRRQGVYEQVRELAKHVTGMYPDFGREISLEALVLWAVDEVCVPHKLAGLLILFDEFSLFLQKYISARAVGKLQELLNGISKRPGKSAFLAFSQQDVDSVAETYAQGQRRDDVKKELERLPKDKRSQLYSLMEGVLAAYLKQDAAALRAWSEQPARRGTFVQAREIVSTHFRRHYADELRWDSTALTEKVLMQCFPLHPLTTAILSVHTFETGAGDNPRTALQFVRRTWEDMRELPAQHPDGRPNFVYPIALADFFGEQLSRKWYTAFRNAVESASEGSSEAQAKVLQALFVQQAVGLKAYRSDQFDLLHHLSGIDRDEVKLQLKDLAEKRIIQFDPLHKFSSLYPASTRPQEVEEIINKATERVVTDESLMDLITQQLPSLGASGLDFGHTSDWSPRQVGLTAEMFTGSNLMDLIPAYRIGNTGIEEGPRGLIIWLVAQTEEEKTRLRQTAQAILDEALKGISSPPPVIVLLPKRAVTSLVANARRYQALRNMSNSDREQIGSVMYQQELGLAEVGFRNSLGELFDDLGIYGSLQRNLVEYALPGAYRASVQALRDLSLDAVVRECYRQAYAYRAEFYTQYAVGGKGMNQLRTATKKVAIWLFGDAAGNSVSNLGQRDIQYQLATNYLTHKWGLLDARTYAIQRPTSYAFRQAWDLLDGAFAPGCRDVPIRSVIVDLLNPPYGHDYNTLTLLLAAWIGFNQHELGLSLDGRLVSLNQLRHFFDDARHPQDFLNRICSISPLLISRSNPDDVVSQANSVLQQIREGTPFGIAAAQDALAKLEQTEASPRLVETRREEIELLRPRLEDALEAARDYDQIAASWLEKVARADLNSLLSIRDIESRLPALSLVKPTQPALEELVQNWETAVQVALTSFCARYAHLSELADYRVQENLLNHVQKALERYPRFAQQVADALEALSQARIQLQKQEGEKAILAEVNSMATSAGLATLYAYRERLATLEDLSPQAAQQRDTKLSQITTHICQYEQIASELPMAVERAQQLNDVRRQRDLLSRNLEQMEGTQLYQPLMELKEKVEQLENFFDRLREVMALPSRTPSDLDTRDAELADLQTHFASCIGPAQIDLLDAQQRYLANLRRQRAQEASNWLAEVRRRLENGESPEVLLRHTESTPPFLPSKEIAELEQLRLLLQERVNEDVMLRIESLFHKIADPGMRHECVRRLQALVGEL